MNHDLDHELFHELQRQVEKQDLQDIFLASIKRYDYTYPGDVRPVYQALIDVGQAAGVRVHRVAKAKAVARQTDGFKPSGEQGAWSEIDPDTGKFKDIFVVTGGMTLAVQAGCLLHEEGHLFTPFLGRYDRHSAEIIAESAAYIVGRQLGFEFDKYSPGYVADWTRTAADDPVLHPERLKRLEMPILNTAMHLGDAINREYSFRKAVAA